MSLRGWAVSMGMMGITALASAAAPPGLATLHAITKMQSTSTGHKPVIQTHEIWVKGARYRTRTEGTVQLLSSTGRMINYSERDPKKRLIVFNGPSMAGVHTTAGMLNAIATATIPKNAKKTKVGTAKWLGYATTIYEVTVPGSPQKMKLWEASVQGARVPMKVDLSGPDSHFVNSVQSIEINKPLPDSFFNPPAGYHREVIPSRPPMPSGNVPRTKGP